MDLALELFLDRADCNTEDPLSLAEDVHDFVRTVRGEDRLTVGKQRFIALWLFAPKLFSNDLHCLSDLLEAHSRV